MMHLCSSTAPFRTSSHENLWPHALNKFQTKIVIVFMDSRYWAGDKQIIWGCRLTTDRWFTSMSSLKPTYCPFIFLRHTDVAWCVSFTLTSRYGSSALFHKQFSLLSHGLALPPLSFVSHESAPTNPAIQLFPNNSYDIVCFICDNLNSTHAVRTNC
jgi:hypothetical protein